MRKFQNEGNEGTNLQQTNLRSFTKVFLYRLPPFPVPIVVKFPGQRMHNPMY